MPSQAESSSKVPDKPEDNNFLEAPDSIADVAETLQDTLINIWIKFLEPHPTFLLEFRS